MFFSGLFQRKSDAPVTTPAELADAIGLSYDTYTGKQISSQRAMRLTAGFFLRQSAGRVGRDVALQSVSPERQPEAESHRRTSA
ncbi:phage portal protein, HK97 family [Escherichia coli]|nr:phage portal protein, HK97 family [Escherichia coli]